RPGRSGRRRGPGTHRRRVPPLCERDRGGPAAPGLPGASPSGHLLHLELRILGGVLPALGKDAVFLVVPRKPADLRFDQLEAPLVAEILPMLLQVSLQVGRPADQTDEVVRDRDLRPLRTQDLCDAATRRESDVRHAEPVAKPDADRGGGKPFLMEPQDRGLEILLFGHDPFRVRLEEGSRGTASAFAFRMEAGHGVLEGALHTAGTYLRFASTRDRHNPERARGDSRESPAARRRPRELTCEREPRLAKERTHFLAHVRSNRVAFGEPVDDPAASDYQEMKIDCEDRPAPIERALGETQNLQPLARTIQPGLDPWPDRRRLPVLENEGASRREMRPHAAETPSRLRPTEVAETTEHADRGIERLREPEGFHPREDEPGSGLPSSRFLPGDREHLRGSIDPGDLVSAMGQKEIVIPRATTEVEDARRRHSISPED